MEVLKLFVLLNMICLCNAAIKCYSCGGLSLEDCKKVKSKCRPEQNRCMSFMLEGGNSGKIYYKRCGRKNECYGYKLQGTCDSKVFIHGSSSCRPACCETDYCNGGTTNRVLPSLWASRLIVIPAMYFLYFVVEFIFS